MEGYSVTEAASVLGVPTERVWELLARGVLAGTPEGETGMRVYLQPRPAPAAPDPTRPNGDAGREPERELSPFRELLTEFRNLTERYGQALLALGESRGEVASLRSRVDLLEARMDLRLPFAAAPAPDAAGWGSASFPTEHTVIPTADRAAEPQPAAEGRAEDEDEHRSRRRGPRRATERFADALARAEDPSPPELPGAADAAAALAALHAESESTSEAALPRELPAAEMVPVADEADESLEAAEAPPAEIDDPAAEDEPSASFEDATEIPEPVRDAAGGLELAATAPAGEEEDEEPAGSASADEPQRGASEPEVDAEESAPTTPLVWDAERYTTAIDEPDWLASDAWEPDPEPRVEVEAPAMEEPEPESAAFEAPEADVAEPEPEPESAAAEAPEADAAEPEPAITSDGAGADADVDVVAPETLDAAEAPETVEVATGEPPPAGDVAATASEETVLWFGRPPDDAGGAEEMEVSSAPNRPAPPAPPGAAMPGADELTDALAAMQAETPAAAAEAPEPVDAAVIIARTQPPTPRPPSVTPRPGSVTSIGTKSPATRAYRRLRRIFPG